MWQRIVRGGVSPALVTFTLAALSGPVPGEEVAAPAVAIAVEPDAAALRYPLGVAVGADGSLAVADRLLPGVWRVVDGRATVLAAGTRRFRTPLNAVRAVAVAPDGGLLVGDSATRELYRLEADGTPVPLTAGAIGIPADIAVDSTGRIFVSDLETQRVWRVDAAGGQPVEVAVLAGPRGLFIDGDDRLWAVAASGPAPLVRIGSDGTIVPVVRTPVFQFPHDVVVDAGGTAYVSDTYARCIWRVPPGGEPERWAEGAPLVGPVGLALHVDRILIADPRARQIFEIAVADGPAAPPRPSPLVRPAGGSAR